MFRVSARMTRDIRYTCKRHGPFLVATVVGPGRKAPTRARCPQCHKLSFRVHRRKPGGVAISVRGPTRALLKAESERRGVPMARLIDEYTKDIV